MRSSLKSGGFRYHSDSPSCTYLFFFDSSILIAPPRQRPPWYKVSHSAVPVRKIMQPVTKDLTDGKRGRNGWRGLSKPSNVHPINVSGFASFHYTKARLCAAAAFTHTHTRKKGAKLKTIRLSASKDLRDRDGHEPAYSCSFALCKFPRPGTAGDEHESE